MTTPQAAAAYLAEHMSQWGDKGWAVYNPHGKPVDDLPAIYGFNNGGSPGWYSGVLLSDDGECLGGHVCSSEGYMPHDLGVLVDARPDRHETFRAHYPDGYRMVFIPGAEVRDHAGLDAACARNKERAAEAAAKDAAP